MVISPEFRMRQHRDEDHKEDAPHFTITKDLLDCITNGEFDPKKHSLKMKQKRSNSNSCSKKLFIKMIKWPTQIKCYDFQIWW